MKNIPILLIQRVDSRRVKKLESKFIGTSRTSDKILRAHIALVRKQKVKYQTTI